MMTFDQLKTEILSRAKPLQICEAYQDVLLSTNQQGMITAAIAADLIQWTYQSGVVDDALLAEFSGGTLNANGIYISGTPTITNPVSPIYLLKNCNATINVSDILKAKIWVMGSAKATINLSDFAHAGIKISGSGWINLTVSADSSACVFMEDSAQAIATANNRSVVHLRTQDDSKLTYMGASESYARIDTFDSSILNVNSSVGLIVNSFGKYQPIYGAAL